MLFVWLSIRLTTALAVDGDGTVCGGTEVVGEDVDLELLASEDIASDKPKLFPGVVDIPSSAVGAQVVDAGVETLSKGVVG